MNGVLLKEQLAARLQQHLDNYEITLKSPRPLEHYNDYEFETGAELTRGSQHAHVTAVYLPAMTLSAVFHAIPSEVRGGAPIFVFGPRVTPRAAETLRSNGLNYLDPSGNAYIHFGDILIDVRGRSTPRSSDDRKAKPGPRKTLFTPRRAQVIFTLLVWPESAHASMKKIAHHSRTSPGLVHDTIQLLVERNFMVSHRDRTLLHREELIDLWTSEYPSGLGAPTTELKFRGDPHRWVAANDAALFISGEAAASDLLRHQTLTLYTSEFDRRLVGANRWRRADEDANIVVRPQFWVDPHHPDEENPYGTTLRAPELLIYADLMASGDSRQIQTAKEIRSSHALSATT